MTRSGRRMLVSEAVRRALIRTSIPVMLATAPAALAQEAGAAAGAGAAGGGLEEVVVTAQKRTENLQDVPVSIQTLTTEKLEQLNIDDIDDYVKYLSGVTTVKGLGQGGTGIGTTHVYMRGVVSGQDGNHSASQPTVGTYLDEQPVTTIDGTRRHPRLRHRAHRGAGGPAGHPLRRKLGGGHHPHHHQQARSHASSPPATTSAATRSITADSAGSSKATSTSRCPRSRRCGWSAGTSTTLATSITSPEPMRMPASSTACARSRWARAVRARFRPAFRASRHRRSATSARPTTSTTPPR